MLALGQEESKKASRRRPTIGEEVASLAKGSRNKGGGAGSRPEQSVITSIIALGPAGCGSNENTKMFAPLAFMFLSVGGRGAARGWFDRWMKEAEPSSQWLWLVGSSLPSLL